MREILKRTLAVGLCLSTLSGSMVFAAGNDGETVDEYASAYQLYVAVDGNDSNPGTEDLPLASLKGAADKVKSLKSTKRFKKRDIAVNFMPGEYKITNYTFDTTYSGTKEGKIIYRAVEPGTVDFRQTIDLPVEKFTKVTDEETLARLAPEARDKVVKIDMTELLGADSYIGYPMETSVPYGTKGVPKLIHNNNLQTIARYPNVGWADMYLQDGEFSIKDGLSSADDYKNNVVVKYDDDHIDNWQVAKNVTLRGKANWIGVGYVLKDVDAENNLLTFGSGTHPQNCNREAGGYNRLYFENILEELDVAGEYWVDEDNKTLYYWPPEELNAENDKLEFITGKERQANLHFNDCSYIEFKDLKFTGATYNMIRFTRGTDITFDGCELSMSVWNPIWAQYVKNFVVENCTIYSSGGGAGIEANDDLDYDAVSNLKSSGLVINNNHMWDLNRETTYTNCPVIASGIQAQMTNNLVHMTCGYAFSGGGAETYVAYNEAYNVLMDTVDTGSFHTGRRWDMYGSTAEYNFFHDVGDPKMQWGQTTWPAAGFYWDDSYAGTRMNNNILVLDAPTMNANGFFENGGRDHGGTGNIIVGATNFICNSDGYSWYAAYDDHPYGAGVNNIVAGLAENFEKLYELARSTNSPYYQKYQSYMDVLHYDLMTQRQYTAKNLVYEDNVLFDVDNIAKLRGTLPEGSYRNGINNADTISIEDNYYIGTIETKKNVFQDQTYTILHQDENVTRSDIFVDPDNNDYRVSENGKKLLGITDDSKFVLDESFDMSVIGYQGEIKTGEDFKKLYPINGEVTAGRKNTVTLKWNKAKFADEYEYSVYKKSDDSLVYTNTTSYNGAIVDRLDPNTEYYWTVKAKFKSFKNPTEWESEGKAYFKTGNFEKVTENILSDSVMFRRDEKRMFVNGKETEIPVGLCSPDEYAVDMVPFKETCEALGMSYSYDESDKVFTVKYNGTTAQLNLGGETYGSDGTLNHGVFRNPFFMDGVAMVDIQFFTNAFGINRYWHKDTNTLIFSKSVDSIRKVEVNDILSLYDK